MRRFPVQYGLPFWQRFALWRGMNDWQTLYLMITQSTTDLPKPQVLPDTMSHEEVVAYEVRKTEDIEAAVNSFSGAGRWPLLDGDEAYLIEERVRFATFLVTSLMAMETAHPENHAFTYPADMTLDRLVRWAMTDAWNKIGRDSWAKGAKW